MEAPFIAKDVTDGPQVVTGQTRLVDNYSECYVF